jgi:predicted dehydrogenase
LYGANHPGVELAACCDLDEARAVRYRDSFGFSRHYTDSTRMLSVEHPDAVCLVVPEPLTCELSCEILGMGYPLIGNAPNRVAFNRRYTPLASALASLLSDEIGLANVQHIRYDFTRVRRTDADFSLTAIHGVDAVRFLAGADYASVRFRYQAARQLVLSQPADVQLVRVQRFAGALPQRRTRFGHCGRSGRRP